uniref:Uncharacterized protein n=1 Tax=Anguilla anguilla TaxID=7936 RepID=A0A0E9WVL1_ANGAN
MKLNTSIPVSVTWIQQILCWIKPDSKENEWTSTAPKIQYNNLF